MERVLAAFHWLWSGILGHLATIGVVAAIGVLGGATKWLAEVRRSWHESNLAKEQLRVIRKLQADEERLPHLVKDMEAVISGYRKEANFHGHLILNPEFFLERMPGEDAKLIRMGIAEIEEKERKWNEVFRR
jgi:hypothetical protein